MGNGKQQRAGTRKAKVFLVDDHPIMREGLAELVNGQEDLTVCGEAEDVQDALKGIAESGPDLAIVDISLKTGSGIELVKDIRRRGLKPALLVLSMHDETVFAERVLRAGAQGYVMKAEPSGTVIAAMREVLNGDVYLSERMKGRLLKTIVGGGPEPGESSIDSLTDRELEVFQLIGEGLGTRQIAERLHLGVKTIESYRSHIKAKLNLRDGNELVHHAIRWAKEEGEGLNIED